MITILNVSGIGHGPEQFARSPIHDMVINELSAELEDRLNVVFVPSADVDIDPETKELVCHQKGPSVQLSRILSEANTIEEGDDLVALAHSSGCIALLEAMRINQDIQGVFLSPTILSPIREIFDSRAFARRYLSDQENARPGRLTPNKMPYSILFDDSYFGDVLMSDLEKRIGLNDVVQMLTNRAHLFLGGNDWNQRAHIYPDCFSFATVVTGETHSFENNDQSPAIVADYIRGLIYERGCF